MKLSERLAARHASRPVLNVALADIVLDPEFEGSVAVRALTVGEKSEAAEAALAYRKRLMKDFPEAHARVFLDDAEFLEDQKQIERLWRAYRDPNDHTKPAFEDPDAIRKTFTVHEVIRLTAFQERAEHLASGAPDLFTEEQRIAIVAACALAADTDIPDRALMNISRAALADLFVWASCKIHKAA